MSESGTPMLTARQIKTVWLSDLAAFIGEVARPGAILMTAYAAMRATITIALKIVDAEKVSGSDAALFVGAIFAGLGTLYGVKGWEKVVQARGDADVRKEQAKTP
jgi:hypothetical protein